MKNFPFLVAALLLVALNVESGHAEANKYRITISSYLLEDSQKRPPGGEASFTVAEGTLGHASLVYFKDGNSVNLTAGSALIPAIPLIAQVESQASIADVFLAADWYVKSSPAKDNHIHVEGVLNKITVDDTVESIFGFGFEATGLDFTVPDNGKETILLHSNYYGKQIYVDVAVHAEGETLHKERITRSVTFDTEYCLYNLETKTYESEGKACVLRMDLDSPEGKVSCFKQRVYKLPEGDSLLYVAAFAIRNPTFIDPEEIKFELEVRHVYVINPVIGDSRLTELESDKTTVVVFNKEILSIAGERTEIEIPQEKNSLLPFKSKETIVLRNSVKEIKE